MNNFTAYVMNFYYEDVIVTQTTWGQGRVIQPKSVGASHTGNHLMILVPYVGQVNCIGLASDAEMYEDLQFEADLNDKQGVLFRFRGRNIVYRHDNKGIFKIKIDQFGFVHITYEPHGPKDKHGWVYMDLDELTGLLPET